MMKKILIIEDDQILVQMYEVKFKHAGYDVETAFDGVEGLEKIQNNKPDLVLLDLIMPKLDGKKLFEKIRFDPDLQKIPIVILTNVDNPTVGAEFIKKGAVGYFTKTRMTPAQVVSEVEAILTHG